MSFLDCIPFIPCLVAEAFGSRQMRVTIMFTLPLQHQPGPLSRDAIAGRGRQWHAY
jgi:hypothetical protein